jgi:hypothetical protein
MNALSFNEKEIAQADQRDLMRFMSMVQEDSRFKNNGRLFVNKLVESDDDNIKTMKTVEIKFQFFKGKEREGKSFIWTTYRAKDFCCSNSSIREIL